MQTLIDFAAENGILGVIVIFWAGVALGSLCQYMIMSGD